jgi:iron(III) transport system ATP-binding protein
MIKVEIQGIGKTYTPGAPVLREISLTIQPGELFFLLGPSGCGKTTLLRLLAGFLRPDAGTIAFDGRDVTRLAPERRDAGLVFQNYALWPHLTVFENVAFGLDTRDIRGEARTRQVMEALTQVRMADYADRKPASLSGGQQQRVALARALAFRPRLLLLDEPLSNLDAKLRDAMRGELRRLCKGAGLTTIYVTHDRREALSMGDRIAVLHQGRLEQIGTPEVLYRHPVSRFVAEFMGPANLFAATVRSLDGATCTLDTPFGTLTAAGPSVTAPVGSAVTAMIRPESVRLAAAGEGPNGFAARVEQGTFLGEAGLWELSVGGSRLTAHESCPPPRAPGASVRVVVAPEQVVLLEAP